LPEIELNPLIQQAAKQEGLDANLLRAVAQQESGFRSCAVSQKGALGLMQLMPATIQELGVHDPFDPAESLLSGARLLKDLLARFDGNTALALGAYNAGPARVEESGGVPQIPETIRYVQQILSRLPIP
jgi:soluble lytic murein transglycosylase-like protein